MLQRWSPGHAQAGRLPFAALALLGAALADSTTASAFKDALRLATERAVATTSRADGFLADPEIRIRLPGKLDSMTKGLRAVGMGAQVDELEVAMNRAAEQAARGRRTS
jgi:hypothetical protein